MVEDIDEKKLKNIKWGDSNEKILKSWSDKAKCYNILHDRSFRRYTSLNSWYTIPVIILSTITGTCNFAQESISQEYKTFFLYFVGGINIFSAVLVAINEKLKLAQKSEGHKIYSADWDKFSRSIKIELSKNRQDRVDCNTFMKTSQEEYDKLKSNSPIIPNDVIRWFKLMIKNGYEENISGIQLCIYESICFPCGIECCNKKYKCLCNKCHSKKNTDFDIDKIGLDLPDIVNGIKPTLINNIDDNNNQYSIMNVV